MTYPAVVFGLALVVMILVVAIIVPVFVNIFNEIKADSPNTDTSLPVMTQITVGISHFVTHYWYVLIAGTAGAATPSCDGRRPIAGAISGTGSSCGSRGSATSSRRSRWRVGRAPSREWSSSGVPILQAIEIAGETSGNAVITEPWTTSMPP